MMFLGFYIPIFPIILIASIVTVFAIEVGRVKRRNDFGVEEFKTATGAVVGSYLLFLAGNAAKIGILVGLFGTLLA